MKALLYKELKLAMHPTAYIFTLFSAMLLVPSYPYFVAFFYPTLAIFFIFLSGRENRDLEYTMLLPVRKRDGVYARFMLIAIIELVQILLSVPFALLSVNINPNSTNFVGMDIGLAFYGMVFLFYTLFNITFVIPFYKTTEKIGKLFLFSATVQFIYIAIVEASMHIFPRFAAIVDTSSANMQIKQLPILILGTIIYAATLLCGAKTAAKKFEKVDL